MIAHHMKHVVIVAGEASGDAHAGALAKAMKARDPAVHITGVGGEAMVKAGVELIADIKSLNVMGITEIVKKVKSISRVFLILLKHLKETPPSLLVLIDFPDFNLMLARFAKHYGIPILFYISPQVWAWRAKRTRIITRLVDKMVVILPFEEAFYKSFGVEVEFVGHPLLDSLKNIPDKQEARKLLKIKDDVPLIGLLPGSRQSEIKRLAPVMLKATVHIGRLIPKAEFILPLAKTINKEDIPWFSDMKTENLRVIENQTALAIKACDLIIAASGTVTLEAAILGTPIVIIYKLSPITYFLARRLIKVPYIGLVNLVAGELLAPELIQAKANSRNIANEARRILENRDLQKYLQKRFTDVKQCLGCPGVADRTARIALQILSHQL